MEQYNDEIQLKDILIKLSEYKAYLVKKKLTIISLSALFFILGIIFTVYIDGKYTAELTFVVEDQQRGNGALGAMSGIASQFGVDFSGGGESTIFSQSNIIELLKSRGVIVSTLMQNAKVNGKTDLLVSHYLEINEILEGWTDSDNLKGFSFHNSSYINDSITGVMWSNIIENNLTIELQTSEANIINLSYESLNQEFAKEFVENLIKEMSKMYVVHKTAQANNTLDFLQDRADSVFVELEIVEQEFAKVKDINQRIIKATGRLKELQLMRRVEVLNTMYLEIIKNLELSKITLLNNTPIINIIDKPILPLEENTLSKKFAGFVGGFLGGFLSLCYFIFRKLFKDSLAAYS